MAGVRASKERDMTSTERINKYIDDFSTKNTLELCRLYNEASTECVFNNYNSNTRAYATLKACEYLLCDDEDASYDSNFDKYRYWDGEEWAEV